MAHSPAFPSVKIVSNCAPLLSLNMVNSKSPEVPGAIFIRPLLSRIRVAPMVNSSTITLTVLSSSALWSFLDVAQIST